MTRSDQLKLLGVVLALGLAVWYLLPTFRFYSLPLSQRMNAPKGSPAAKLRENAIPLGLDLQGGLHLVLEVDRSRLSPAEARDAVDRAMTILNARIDQFGVAEPLVQKQGEDRIVVQLPGLTDAQRAKDLIGKTALLEFKLVRTPEEGGATLQRLDTFLASRIASGQLRVDTAFATMPLTSRFVENQGSAGFVLEEDVDELRRMIAQSQSVLGTDTQLLWGEEEESNGRTGRWLYLVKRQPELAGGTVAHATSQVGLDETNPGGWGVSLQLTPRGGSQFAQVTGANVGRQLAIVLDDVVQSAPSIRERIPRGTAQISGRFTPDEAKDLAVVLEAGSLPAPVRIAEERTVGPSLGSDSIRDGLRAAWIGALAVVIFTLVYYRLSGALAVVALALNMVFLLACLAGFGATLTLPGIAGIALTIGMAVDANVLILERVREELRQGKTVRAAIQTGYDRAFRTILDANVTTLISAAFLFQFGTGPIRGFAVTLAIGIITNMFTAVFVTRLIYDLILQRRTVSKLSI